MKRFILSVVMLGYILLIALSVLVSQQRKLQYRAQALPALLVGSGLIVRSKIERSRRRARLVIALRHKEVD